MSIKCIDYFHGVTWLTYTFLVLQDLVVSGRAGVEDFILYFLVPEAVEVALLKQVLPSIHTPQALRGLPIQPMRTTTLLALIKVNRTKYCYNIDIPALHYSYGFCTDTLRLSRCI